MSINTSSVTGTTSTQTPDQVVNPGSQLGKDDFLKLLAVQLKNQDPASPSDNQQFMAQMAQFSALEQTTNMAQGLTQMAFAGQVSQSVSLIGHTIGYTKADGSVGTGVAQSVAVSNNAIEIKVGNDVVTPGEVTFVGGVPTGGATP
jgi:flagellar basal-body rod modification protein FlgD